MTRHASDDRQRHAMIQAGNRAIARGERPLYRLRSLEDGRWAPEGLPWLSVSAQSRGEALAAARVALAAMLDVPADAFDVET